MFELNRALKYLNWFVVMVHFLSFKWRRKEQGESLLPMRMKKEGTNKKSAQKKLFLFFVDDVEDLLIHAFFVSLLDFEDGVWRESNKLGFRGDEWNLKVISKWRKLI